MSPGSVRYTRGVRASWLPSAEQLLLLKACVVRDDSWRELWNAWRWRRDVGSIDAISQKLLPLIYVKVGTHAVDDPVLDLARKVYLALLAQNGRRAVRLAEVIRRFEILGVETVLLKGAAMSAVYYQSGGVRDMGDVDLLIRRIHLRTCGQVLQQNGWVPDDGLTLDEIEGEARIRHARSFSADTEYNLDLHWRPIGYCYSPRVEDLFWEAAQRMELCGVLTRHLAATDQFFHVCVHAIQLAWVPSVRWIVDAMTILHEARGSIDWRRLVVVANEANMGMRLRTALVYLRDEFDSPIPSAVLDDLDDARRPAWERAEHRLQARRPPLGLLDSLRWHWWHFGRVRRFDTIWRRRPTVVGFLDYVRVWNQIRPRERLMTFVRCRTKRRWHRVT